AIVGPDGRGRGPVAKPPEGAGRLHGGGRRRVCRAPTPPGCARARGRPPGHRAGAIGGGRAGRTGCGRAAPGSPGTGGDHRRIHYRGPARKDLQRVLYRQVAARRGQGSPVLMLTTLALWPERRFGFSSKILSRPARLARYNASSARFSVCSIVSP